MSLDPLQEQEFQRMKALRREQVKREKTVQHQILGRQRVLEQQMLQRQRFEQAEAQRVGEKYVSGEPVSVKELAPVAKKHPEFMKGVVEAKTERGRAEAAARKYLEGKTDVREVAWAAKTFPEFMKATVERRREQLRVERVGKRFLAGEPVSIREISPVAKAYPEYLGKLATERQRVISERKRIAMERELAEKIGIQYLKGEPVTAKELGWLGKTYPGFAKSLVNIRAFTTRYQRSAQKILTEQATVKRREMEAKAVSIGFRYITRKPVSAKELGWLGKTYPSFAGSLFKTRFFLTRYAEAVAHVKPTEKPVFDFDLYERELTAKREEWQATGVPRKQWTTLTREWEKQRGYTEFYPQIEAERSRRFSERFYTSLGFPEYAGKYQPFLVPEGYKIAELKESGEGVVATFAPEKPVKEAESITSILSRTILLPSIAGGTSFTVPKEKAKEGIYWQLTMPGRGLGEIAAPTEALVYGGARLVGVETPEVPATFLSEALASGRFSQPWLERYPHPATTPAFVPTKGMLEYLADPVRIVGSIAGELVLSYGVSKTVESAGKAVAGKLETSLLRKYVESPLSLSKTERWMLGKLHPHLATEVLSSSRIMDVLGTAEELEYIQTPKTTLLSLGKVPTESKRVLQTFFVRSGLIYTLPTQRAIEIATRTRYPRLGGFEKEPYAPYSEGELHFQRTLLPQPISGTLPHIPVLEKIVTTGGLAEIPYLPVFMESPVKTSSRLLFGVSAITRKTAKKGLTQAALTLKVKRLEPQRLFEAGKARQRGMAKLSSLPTLSLRKLEKLVPAISAKVGVHTIPRLMPFSVTVQKAETASVQVQKQVLGQKQIQIQTTQTLQTQMFRGLPKGGFDFRLKETVAKRKRGKDLFGWWTFRKYPLATEARLSKIMFGQKQRKR